MTGRFTVNRPVGIPSAVNKSIYRKYTGRFLVNDRSFHRPRVTDLDSETTGRNTGPKLYGETTGRLTGMDGKPTGISAGHFAGID